MSNSVKILIGITGSVATIKLPLLISNLFEKCFVNCFGSMQERTNRRRKIAGGIEIRVVATKPALHFINVDDIRNIHLTSLTKAPYSKGPFSPVVLYTDQDEWDVLCYFLD